jgi:hypothetical protein
MDIGIGLPSTIPRRSRPAAGREHLLAIGIRPPLGEDPTDPRVQLQIAPPAATLIHVNERLPHQAR